MSGPPKSALGDTGLRLGPEASAGNLGNEYQRKNRGRYSEILTGAPWFRLIDVVGDDQLARQCTITCGVERKNASNDVQQADPTLWSSFMPACVGRVQWGTDGASHVAEFDWLHGVVFSVAASAIRVDVRIESDPAEIGAVLARASIGYLPRPASRGLRRTFFSAEPLPDALGAAFYPIPAFATSYKVYVWSDPTAVPSLGADVLTAQVMASGALLPVVMGLGEVQADIVPGATRVGVGNLSTVPQSHCVVFEVSL